MIHEIIGKLELNNKINNRDNNNIIQRQNTKVDVNHDNNNIQLDSVSSSSSSSSSSTSSSLTIPILSGSLDNENIVNTDNLNESYDPSDTYECFDELGSSILLWLEKRNTIQLMNGGYVRGLETSAGFLILQIAGASAFLNINSAQIQNGNTY